MYSLTSLKKRRAGPSRPYFLQGFMSINIHPAPRIVQQFHRSAAQFLQDSFSSSLRMPKRRPVSKAMVWDCRFFYASAAPPAPVPRPREKRGALRASLFQRVEELPSGGKSSTGGVRGGEARLQWNRMPRKAFPGKARGARSGDFHTAERWERSGIVRRGKSLTRLFEQPEGRARRVPLLGKALSVYGR